MWQPVTYVTHNEFGENKIEICDLKGTFYLIQNVTNDAIIYKSSLYATSWTFWKNNCDRLWHYIRYITKSTPYKIEVLTVVVYFYSFPACYLEIYLHWVFSTFYYLSHIADLKPLSFVVFLQQFVKHINHKVQPYHLNVSFFAIQMFKSCHNPIISLWMFIISVHIAEILQLQLQITPFRTYFQQVTCVTTHNYWKGILHYPIFCAKS